jgi:hypothetical protein
MTHLRRPLISGAAEKTEQKESTDRIREDGLVIEETLGPVHKGVNIFGSRELRRAFVAHAVFPEVFVSGSRKRKRRFVEHHSDDDDDRAS